MAGRNKLAAERAIAWLVVETRLAELEVTDDKLIRARMAEIEAVKLLRETKAQ